jgi:hypothetical protein
VNLEFKTIKMSNSNQASAVQSEVKRVRRPLEPKLRHQILADYFLTGTTDLRYLGQSEGDYLKDKGWKVSLTQFQSIKRQFLKDFNNGRTGTTVITIEDDESDEGERIIPVFQSLVQLCGIFPGLQNKAEDIIYDKYVTWNNEIVKFENVPKLFAIIGKFKAEMKGKPIAKRSKIRSTEPRLIHDDSYKMEDSDEEDQDGELVGNDGDADFDQKTATSSQVRKIRKVDNILNQTSGSSSSNQLTGLTNLDKQLAIRKKAIVNPAAVSLTADAVNSTAAVSLTADAVNSTAAVNLTADSVNSTAVNLTVSVEQSLDDYMDVVEEHQSSSSSSSSSSGNSATISSDSNLGTEAAGAIISVVVPNKIGLEAQGKDVYERFNRKALLKECGIPNNKTVMRATEYRKYINQHLILKGDLRGLLTRETAVGEISFYDCIRIVTYNLDHGDTVKPPERPGRGPMLVEYGELIQEVKNKIRNTIHNRYDNDKNELLIKSWVKDWKEDSTILKKKYPNVDRDIRNQLTNIDSIESYLEITNAMWYGATELEVESAAEVFKVNIMVWDMPLGTYISYKHRNNRLYCFITKDGNQYNVRYGANRDRKWVFLFTWEELTETVKSLFNLYDNEEANFEFYLKGV